MPGDVCSCCCDKRLSRYRSKNVVWCFYRYNWLLFFSKFITGVDFLDVPASALDLLPRGVWSLTRIGLDSKKCLGSTFDRAAVMRSFQRMFAERAECHDMLNVGCSSHTICNEAKQIDFLKVVKEFELIDVLTKLFLVSAN